MRSAIQQVYLFFSLFVLVTPLFSQEAPSEKVDVKAEVIEYYEQGRLLVAKKNVVVTYRGIRLLCPTAKVQLDSKLVICSGETTVYQGGIIYKGYDLIYDLDKQSGQAHQARIEAPPLYGGGDLIKQRGPGAYEVEKGYITTCDREKPHYKITTKHISVKPNGDVVAHNALIWAGPIPILYVPSYNHSIIDKRPKISIVPGRRKEWGTFLLSSYRYELSEKLSGNLLLDYRDNLGEGSGTIIQYQSPVGKGDSRLYYTQERRRDLPEGVPAERQRYQTHLAHDWQMGPRTRTFIEFNKRSDSSFVKDYFEREYERENNPETHWDWTHHMNHSSIEGYIRKRTNDFEAVTERLPEIRWHLNSARLFNTPLYDTFDTSFTNFEKKSANTGASDDIIRYDFFNEVEYPNELWRWLDVNPHLGLRETFYSRGKSEQDSLIRGIFSTGLDFGSRFFKTYGNLSSDSAQMRHIVTPQVKYLYIHNPTVAVSKITNMGGPDTIERTNRLNFSVEQKWQSKKRENQEAENFVVNDVARLLLTTNYDFKGPQGGQFGTALADLELYPLKKFSVNADAQYETFSRDWTIFNLDFQFEPDPERKISFGHRYLQNESTQETFEIKTKISSKWKLRVYERLSLKSFRENRAKRINDFLEQEYTLVRDLHCWEAEFNYNIESGNEFWLLFRLKAFDQIPFDLKQRSYAPSPGAKQTGS